METRRRIPPRAKVLYIRIPVELHERLTALAKADERSLSLYVIRLLRERVEEAVGE